MIFIYRFFYSIAQKLFSKFDFIVSGKTRNWLRLRSSRTYLDTPVPNALWFHASSGEIEYCKSVITELKNENPNQSIILSYSSPSAEKLFFNIKDQVDLIFPLPWDTQKAISDTLNHFQPRAVIFSRTDFWPEFISQLHQRKIPMMAISMFPDLTAANRFIYRWLLKDFSLITTVSEQKSLQLSKSLNKEVLTFADSRIDQVFSRLESPSRISFADPAQIIVFASTWSEDEEQVLSIFPTLIQMGFQIILAPHETARSKDLSLVLKGLQPTLLSDYPSMKNLKLTSALLIVDQVGYLADIYRSTDFTFVGGSFKKRVHSVMEPLATGNTVFFGPCFKNSPEAIESHQLALTFLVSNGDDIIKFIQGRTKAELETHKKASREYIDKQRGSSRLIARKILNQLEKESI